MNPRKLFSLVACFVVIGLFTGGCSSETEQEDEEEESEDVGTSAQPLCASPRIYSSVGYLSGASPDLYMAACGTRLQTQCFFKRGRLSNVTYSYAGRTTVSWTCSGLCTYCI